MSGISALAGRPAIVVCDVKIIETIANRADCSHRIDFFDIDVKGIQSDAYIGPSDFVCKKQGLIVTINEVCFKPIEGLNSESDIVLESVISYFLQAVHRPLPFNFR